MDLLEKVEAPPQRVISMNGQVTRIPGKVQYQSQITVVWEVTEPKDPNKTVAQVLEDFKNKLMTKLEYANLEDLDSYYESREE